MKQKNQAYSIMAKKLLASAAVTLVLSGCGIADRLERVGQAPDLAPITNPQAEAGYQPVSMPMPNPIPHKAEANSLWRQGARSFFKDQRAASVGDIITVNIDISESASLSNETERTRTNTEEADVLGLFGLEDELTSVLPEGATPGDLVDLDTGSSSEGTGAINRSESISLDVAALIVQVLPNGNLVLQGRQEVRVNHELRQLMISGIIRPADISSTNSIDFDKIAEARISYGGEGYISDVQQARYGQQIYDILMPF